MVNENALQGTGLPHHPWSLGADVTDGLPTVANATESGRPVSGSHRTNADYAAAGAAEQQSGPEQGSYRGKYNSSRDSEASFVAISSVADTDEWSAALVNAGLVQSLVRSLQACLEIRSMFGLAVEAVEPEDDAPLSGTKSMPSIANTVAWTESDCCLGFSLEVVQVEIMLAIGGLLSAHPLAARDRFLLVGGAVALSRVVSAPPCGRNKERGCLPGGGVDTEGTATAAAIAAPLVHEHCCLVAVQLLRLCLRSGASVPLPVDLVVGATGLVEALPHAMRALWEKHARGECGIDRFFPANLLRGGRAELEHGTSPRPSVRSREFLPLRCPAEVCLNRSGEGENCSVGAEACGEDKICTPKAPSSVAQAHPPSTLRSFLLCR